jgi:selT/selW/selH-like putative selenoprotein
MQRYFVDLKNYLETKYPELRGHIVGGLYPPPAYAVTIANLASYLWFGGIFLMVGGSAVLNKLGIPVPDFVRQLENNRLPVFLGLFMLNNLANGLVSTGAFEVYLDDQLVFSKLEAKRFPAANDVIQGLAMFGLLPADMQQ